jgi:hypothetical protein
MFLSKKHLNILYEHDTGDLDFKGICYILKLSDKEIDTLLDDKGSIEILFEDFGIYIDFFNQIKYPYFNEENSIKCIEAIYKHGLEQSPDISERLQDFTDRFIEYYRSEPDKDKYKNYLDNIPQLKSLLD